jgi:hypothetical protein
VKKRGVRSLGVELDELAEAFDSLLERVAAVERRQAAHEAKPHLPDVRPK